MSLSDYYDVSGAIKKVASVLVIFSPLPLFGVGFCVADHSFNGNSIKQAITKIEQNVEKKAGFAKFTHNAFTVGEENNQKYLTVFGVAQEAENSKPRFSSVTYPLSSTAPLFDEIYNDVKIEYEYSNGQMVGAENKFSYNFIERYRRVNECGIYIDVAKVTNQTILNKQLFGEVEQTENAVQKNAVGSFKVNGIGEVNISKEEGKASFTIDLADLEKDGKITAKRLVVIQPLTEEILKDSKKAYDFYVNHTDECEIRELDLYEDNLHRIIEFQTKDGKDMKAYVPEELLEF